MTSATSGTSPASSQRTVAPCGVAPTSRAGQTLRGLPSGRVRYSATDSGRTAANTGPVGLLGDGDHARRRPAGRCAPAPRAGQQRAARPAGRRSRCVDGRLTSAGVPACTTRPSSTTTTRSASAMASTGSWVTSTVLPAKSARCRRSSARTVEPGAGVQRRQRLVEQQQAGSPTSARASAARCAWPPESWPGRRSPSPASPTRSSQAPAAVAGRLPAACRGCAARRRRSRRRTGAGRAGSPGRPCRARRRCAGTCTPPRRPRPSAVDGDPAVVRAAAARRARRSSVDLPAPFGPEDGDAPRRRPPRASTSRSSVPAPDAGRRPTRLTRPAPSSGRASGPAAASSVAERDHEQHQRSAIAASGSLLQGEVDRERHRLRRAREVAGEGDRRAELAERPGPAEHRPGGDPGRDQRQRDPAERRPPVGAEGGGGVLEPGVGGRAARPRR